MDLEILLRNARFAAWREYGLRFEGGWSVLPLEERDVLLVYGLSELEWPGLRLPQLSLRCGTCGRHERGELLHPSLADSLLEAFRGWELTLVARLELEGCHHLAPLSGGDPEGVRALCALLLVSG